MKKKSKQGVDCKPRPNETTRHFIDLFAGCGGFSLGLTNNGWRGLFAIEKDSMAFETLGHNLVNKTKRFDWPEQLPRSHHDIHHVLENDRAYLQSLNGKVKLVAGGPPCQGFSMAGRRKEDDARNSLMHQYIEFIGLVRPEFLLVENVRGMAIDFDNGRDKGNARGGISLTSHAGQLLRLIEESGYHVSAGIVRSVELGIPQLRPRLIFLGIREDKASVLSGKCPDLDIDNLLDHDSQWFQEQAKKFLKSKDLTFGEHITVEEAIGDLTNPLKLNSDHTNLYRDWDKDLPDYNPAVDPDFSRGTFRQHNYLAEFKTDNAFLKQMRREPTGEEFKGKANSLRMANHRKDIEDRFRTILADTKASGRRGVILSKEERVRLGIKKHSLVVLKEDKPSHTITTLPDDILHYEEPRILTVRENARLQTFPDWFEFKGIYTTGGDRRGTHCPRYTQVGNAVPPFLAEFLGLVIDELAILIEQ